ncbi:FecR domain-containing protein [Fulvivirga maritima]|uniref:FecR family protein n=1 Tax=Fulvivirga maritima TaxID=2904247 RepID=UPI001F2A2BEF|nr:FecR family protein [Fulvivirga maritima]UII26418.1 FecR domain-containing protein [Fulvivirga maritima]
MAASVLILMSLISAFFFHQLNKKPEASADNIKWITKATPNGQRSVVRLKDGSVVTLNAGSSITYPEFFDKAKRQIKLKGEAFFEVSKNAAWPFVVESQGVLTTVLGTSFNIKAFDNQNTQVTVATGKVKVASTDIDVPQEAILRPNQQANFRLEDELMEVKEVDIDNYLAWKTNELYFDMIPFSEVLEVLEKKYNVHIAMTNDLSSKCLVRARYKNESLETVLKGLQLLVHFNFKIHDGNKITVEGMGCED